jgi:uncharacterized DUF497 family protein/predicted DNA binding CopG/RHH family protein
MEFEWNESKNRINMEKHGVSFYDAQYAFADPKHLILEDIAHSVDEKRFFCIGKTSGGIATVRFVCRRKKFASLAPAIGGKGKNIMKKHIKYTDEPSDVDIDAAQVIKDFLPPPNQLVFKEKTVKITLALSEDSVIFFKAQADKHGLKYQQMIRSLIDKYVSAHTHSA